MLWLLGFRQAPIDANFDDHCGKNRFLHLGVLGASPPFVYGCGANLGQIASSERYGLRVAVMVADVGCFLVPFPVAADLRRSSVWRMVSFDHNVYLALSVLFMPISSRLYANIKVPFPRMASM
jgi:hypothetical protein